MNVNLVSLATASLLGVLGLVAQQPLLVFFAAGFYFGSLAILLWKVR